MNQLFLILLYCTELQIDSTDCRFPKYLLLFKWVFKKFEIKIKIFKLQDQTSIGLSDISSRISFSLISERAPITNRISSKSWIGCVRRLE